LGVSARMTEPTVVFDGECAFCRHWAQDLGRFLSRPPSAVPSSSVDLEQLGLSGRDIERSVWLITPTKHIGGAAAIAAIFRAQPEFHWRLLGHLMDTWPVSVLAEMGYKVVSASRKFLPAPSSAHCDAPQH
jgi:predicted DCC family thiol-disulfide oxidoreductase YuxK